MSPGGELWLVATPIGTLGDTSPRAREILAAVDLILAEDTRRTGRLLHHLDIASGGRLRSLHEHNEAEQIERLVDEIGAGARAALVSDAGTPVLSDPGFLLVRAARASGITVLSVPGPSAFTAALAASGQPPLPAVLVGFLPPRSGARRRTLERWREPDATLVVFLSPHRLRTELEAAASVLGTDRPATLLAELSKVHERAQSGGLGELARSDEAASPRGEYVLVVGPPPPVAAAAGAADVKRAYERATRAGLTRREALRQVADELGISRRRVYASLLDGGDGDGETS